MKRQPVQITIWTNGREVVCQRVENANPIRKSRIGYYAFVSELVNHPHSSKDFVHVYYQDASFTPPCYFYWGNEWYRCFILVGQTISFAKPMSRRAMNYAIQGKQADIDQLCLDFAVQLSELVKHSFSR